MKACSKGAAFTLAGAAGWPVGWLRGLRRALLCLLVAGCGGGGGSGQAPPAADARVTATVGAAGGTITGPGGITLEIPPDALAGDTALTIAIDDAGAPPVPQGLEAAGPVFALLPHGTRFSVPVTLTVPLTGAAASAGRPLAILKTNDLRSGWTAPVTERRGDTLVAAITSFSNGGIYYIGPGRGPAPIVLLSNPLPCSVGEGGFCFFAAGATSASPLSYQWLRNGVPLAGETFFSIILSSVAFAENGDTYAVQIRNADGQSVTTVPAPLTVLPAAPKIVTQPLDLQATAGTAAVFSAASTSGAPQTLQWKRCNPGQQACPASAAAWTNAPGATSTTLVQPNVALGDSGSFFAMCASNAGGTSCSQAAQLTVVAQAQQPVIRDEPDDVSTVAGRSVSFVVLAEGGSLSYQWERSDAGGPFVPLANETSATYTISNAAPVADDGARVRVVVRNTVGFVQSREARLAVSGGFGSAPGRVFGGGGHSLGLRGDAAVIGWGANGSGQLGTGSLGPAQPPTSAAGLGGVAQLTVGNLHTLALGNDGTVRAWGFGGNGRLGLGNTDDVAAPTVVPVGPARSAAAGLGHSLVVSAGSGLLRGWGANSCGQVGDGTNVQRLSPVPVPVGGSVRVYAGPVHSHALRADGTVWSWGCNNDGQLGDGTRQARLNATPVTGVNQVIALAAGGSHTLALRSDGTVWAWGRGNEGQLGDGANTTRESPVPVALPGIAVAVAAGLRHSLALLSDGRVYAWGSNAEGSLGDGTALNAALPQRVAAPLPADIVSIGAGIAHSLAMDRAGNVWAWGRNSSGQVLPGGALLLDRPVQVQGVNLN